MSDLEQQHKLWDESKKKLDLNIWKLSHGREEFIDEELTGYLENHLAVVHESTGRGAGKNFINQPVGTYFFLCHSSDSLQIVGFFTSEAIPCEKGDGWLQRYYKPLKAAISNKKGLIYVA